MSAELLAALAAELRKLNEKKATELDPGVFASRVAAIGYFACDHIDALLDGLDALADAPSLRRQLAEAQREIDALKAKYEPTGR